MPLATRTEPRSRRAHYSADGEWKYTRGAGSFWVTIHAPTDWDTGLLDATLRDARTNPPTIHVGLYRQAWQTLARVEDVITYEDGTTISSHDRARGLLTWLFEHHPQLFTEQP
jgi:hypothetical protein